MEERCIGMQEGMWSCHVLSRYLHVFSNPEALGIQSFCFFLETFYVGMMTSVAIGNQLKRQLLSLPGGLRVG